MFGVTIGFKTYLQFTFVRFFLSRLLLFFSYRKYRRPIVVYKILSKLPASCVLENSSVYRLSANHLDQSRPQSSVRTGTPNLSHTQTQVAGCPLYFCFFAGVVYHQTDGHCLFASKCLQITKM